MHSTCFLLSSTLLYADPIAGHEVNMQGTLSPLALRALAGGPLTSKRRDLTLLRSSIARPSIDKRDGQEIWSVSTIMCSISLPVTFLAEHLPRALIWP